MWDAITYVDPVHNPIISEGDTAAKLVILNAGPSSVRVQGWNMTKPDSGDPADINLKLWPGNAASVNANLIRVGITDGPSHTVLPSFAAIAWKVVS
ncbi:MULTISPECIES: hypothetical protein [Rhizobium]|uniref:hypothetical protein n=1 Tax=Rhizobium TaxID=379 RepID=UPI00103213AB|nr:MULTISPECIES: hypothetical protein [Rhizobium]TBF24880.1 hypothetical protein ELG88_33785 [Rhizobium leguminosarum]WSH48596.1 hypothetical protein U8P77_35350 [Rhizobium johnstonii]